MRTARVLGLLLLIAPLFLNLSSARPQLGSGEGRLEKPKPPIARELPEKSPSSKQLQKLQSLSLKDLFQRYEEVSSRSGRRETPVRDLALTEMVRRGGRECERFLAAKLEEWKREFASKGSDHHDWGRLDNLELVTALRRIQKKRDPLVIQVKTPMAKPYTTRELSPLAVCLKNVDEEKVPIWFAFGGDYRSGRLARWKCQVQAADGKLLPDRDWDAMMGGGMFREGVLEPGQTWEATIYIDSNVKIREPGSYTVRVFYHNRQTIADSSDLTGLILCRSKPFTVKVTKAPRTVHAVKANKVKEARRMIRLLPETGSIRLVGRYGPAFHDFVKPESPEGKLHELGWNAVPALLDALKDDKLSIQRRVPGLDAEPIRSSHCGLLAGSNWTHPPQPPATPQGVRWCVRSTDRLEAGPSKGGGRGRRSGRDPR